jgi:hypothetical protein
MDDVTGKNSNFAAEKYSQTIHEENSAPMPAICRSLMPATGTLYSDRTHH